MSSSFSVPSHDHSRITIASNKSKEESTYSGLFSMGKLEASTAGSIAEHRTFSVRVLSNLGQLADKYLDLGIETFSGEDGETRVSSDESMHTFENGFENEEQSVDDTRLSALSQTRTYLSGASSILESADESTVVSKADIDPILSSMLGAPSTSLISPRAYAHNGRFSEANTPESLPPAPSGTNRTRCNTAGSSTSMTRPPTMPTTSALQSKRVDQDCPRSPKEECEIVFGEEQSQISYSFWNDPSLWEISTKTPQGSVSLSMHLPVNEETTDGIEITKETTGQPQHEKKQAPLVMSGKLVDKQSNSAQLHVDTKAVNVYNGSEAGSTLKTKATNMSQSKRPPLSAGSSPQKEHTTGSAIHKPATETGEDIVGGRLSTRRRTLRSLIPHPLVKGREGAESKSSSEEAGREFEPDTEFPILSSRRVRAARAAKNIFSFLSESSHKGTFEGFDSDSVRVLDTTDTSGCESIEVARESPHQLSCKESLCKLRMASMAMSPGGSQGIEVERQSPSGLPLRCAGDLYSVEDIKALATKGVEMNSFSDETTGTGGASSVENILRGFVPHSASALYPDYMILDPFVSQFGRVQEPEKRTQIEKPQPAKGQPHNSCKPNDAKGEEPEADLAGREMDYDVPTAASDSSSSKRASTSADGSNILENYKGPGNVCVNENSNQASQQSQQNDKSSEFRALRISSHSEDVEEIEIMRGRSPSKAQQKKIQSSYESYSVLFDSEGNKVSMDPPRESKTIETKETGVLKVNKALPPLGPSKATGHQAERLPSVAFARTSDGTVGPGKVVARSKAETIETDLVGNVHPVSLTISADDHLISMSTESQEKGSTRSLPMRILRSPFNFRNAFSPRKQGKWTPLGSQEKASKPILQKFKALSPRKRKQGDLKESNPENDFSKNSTQEKSPPYLTSPVTHDLIEISNTNIDDSATPGSNSENKISIHGGKSEAKAVTRQVVVEEEKPMIPGNLPGKPSSLRRGRFGVSNTNESNETSTTESTQGSDSASTKSSASSSTKSKGTDARSSQRTKKTSNLTPRNSMDNDRKSKEDSLNHIESKLARRLAADLRIMSAIEREKRRLRAAKGSETPMSETPDVNSSVMAKALDEIIRKRLREEAKEQSRKTRNGDERKGFMDRMGDNVTRMFSCACHDDDV